MLCFWHKGTQNVGFLKIQNDKNDGFLKLLASVEDAVHEVDLS